MSDLDLMRTPELLAHIKRLETENAELRQQAEGLVWALEQLDELRQHVRELTQFAAGGPYYVLGQGGFATDTRDDHFTRNLRYALNFPTWLAADDYGRAAGLYWWVVLKAANFDTEHGLLGNMARLAEDNDA